MFADLSGLLLDCAAWGVTDPKALCFLDPPPAPAVAEAKVLLQAIGALDAAGRLTEEGKAIRALPLPPRLARMLVDAGRRGEAGLAADIAAVITERGLGGDGAHLGHRLDSFRRDRSGRAEDMRRLARGWAQAVGGGPPGDASQAGRVLALAFPDRVARARGAEGSFVMGQRPRRGRGAARSARARTFPRGGRDRGRGRRGPHPARRAALGRGHRAGFADRIEAREEVSFDRAAAALRARRLRRRAVTLAEQTFPVPPGEDRARKLAEGIASLGIERLPWTKALAQRRNRVMFMRRADPGFPDLSDAALAASAGEWLGPFIQGRTGLAQIGADTLGEALHALLPWDLGRRLDAECPTHFAAPTGNSHAIDYESGEEPVRPTACRSCSG